MLSLAKVVCDYILLYICTRLHPSFKKKYELVDKSEEVGAKVTNTSC